jgi:hypothetical protein
MRIPLNVLDDEITLAATVRAPRIVGSINFLVDTGSATSFIGGIDTRRFGIPFKKMNFRDEDRIFWGDSPFRLAKLRHIELWTKTSENRLHIFRLPFLYVSPDFIHTKEGDVSPNVLGLDFLRFQKLSFCFQGIQNLAFMETV